jgi:hypothetical protein
MMAMSLLIPLALLILCIPLVLGILRINELFYLEVRGGRTRVVRGRIPQKLLHDIDGVVRDLTVDDVAVRAVIEDGRACIYVHGKGVPRPLRQRLRNTISLWPLAKIRNAPKLRG